MATNRPHGNRFQLDFDRLKKLGAIDIKGMKALKSVAKKYRRFLVVGNLQSRKDTVSNALAAHLHELSKEPMILPTIEGRSITAIVESSNWATYRSLLRHRIPAVVTVGYQVGDVSERYMPRLPGLAAGFEVVLDVRRLGDGQRVVAQIFVLSQERFRCVYRHPEFASVSSEDRAA